MAPTGIDPVTFRFSVERLCMFHLDLGRFLPLECEYAPNETGWEHPIGYTSRIHQTKDKPVSRRKREYDVLLGVKMSKIVTVRAHSMEEARGVIHDQIPEEDQLGGELFTESVGNEFVIDVVRAGEPWHFDRKTSSTR